MFGQSGREAKQISFAGALSALVLAAFVVLVASACGGNAEDGGPTPAGPARPTVAIPGVPPDSAEKAGLLVYRDTVAGQVFALNLSTKERLPVTGIAPGSAPTMTAFDCSRDGRLIAYVNSAAQGRISVLTYAGEGAPEGTEVQGSIQGIAFSPDGQRIAMNLYDQTGVRVALLDVGSGEMTPLNTGDGTPGVPRWSPDGQRLVLDINRNGLSDIYIMDVVTSTLTKVSTRPTAFTSDWSPDGSTIVYSAGDEQGGQPQLYAVNADGSNERKLTASETQKWAPRWSLDGSLIAYAGALAVPVVSARAARLHTQAVWVTGPDGSSESPVTDITLDAFPLGWCLRSAWLE